MDTEVILAILSFAGTGVGTLGGILATSKLTAYRIQQLEKKVEEHNKIIDRVYKVEKTNAVIEEEIRVVNHRIKDLEGAETKCK